MAHKLSVASVRNTLMQLLDSFGVPRDQSEIIINSIVYAHQSGKGTHGLGRVPLYIKKIQSGFMSAVTGDELIRDSPVVAVMDAKNGFGQVAATKAMELCIKKATIHGIGLVGVRNSNNFGTASFIAEQAVTHGMIGIVLGNSGPAIAPTGGSRPIFGTNPLAIAFPNPMGKFPISLDMATSAVARGKIRQAAKNGEKIPFGWALDKNGQPTDDPLQALAGSMIPIGDHKGYGLSLVIDILAGLLTGSAFGGDVHPLGDMSANSNYGHFCMAINIEFFMSLDDWAKKTNLLFDNVKKATSVDYISIPGERSYIKRSKCLDSFFVEETVVAGLERLGINKENILNEQ